MSQREGPSDDDAAQICTSAAFFMPMNDRTKIDDQLRISRSGITLVAPGAEKRDYACNLIYTSREEFLHNAYAQLVAPLVHAAVEGESTMVLCGGAHTTRLNPYLFSSGATDGLPGLMVAAAEDLLSSITDEVGQMHGVVRFSWFRVDNSAHEAITDLLRAASSSSQGGIAATANGAERALAVKEAGRGRGLAIPNLLEVEISHGQDIEQIVSQVLKVIPRLADHTSGLCHTVLQLTLTPASTQAYVQQHGANLGTDPPGLGRVAFLLLSQPSQQQAHTPLPWVETLTQCVSPQTHTAPFHKSRLALYVKDVVLKRQRSAVLHFLQANVDQRSANAQWLEIIQHLTCTPMQRERERMTRAASFSSLPPPPSSSSIATNNNYGNNNNNPAVYAENNGTTSSLRRSSSQSKILDMQREQQREMQKTTQSVSSKSSHSSQRPHSAGSQPETAPQAMITPHNKTVQQKHKHKQQQQHAQQHTHHTSTTHNGAPSSFQDPFAQGQSLTSAESTVGSPPPPPPSLSQPQYYEAHGYADEEEEEAFHHEDEEGFAGAAEHKAYPTAPPHYEDSYLGESPQPRMPLAPTRSHSSSRLPPPAHTASHSAKHGIASLSRQNSNSTINGATATGPAAHNNMSSNVSTKSRGRTSSMETAYTEDMTHHENEAALSLALEASRSEAAALRVAYNYANDRFNETKTAYDALLAQLKEEGAMLSQRDRERYKSAMKDLKDYQIYKEVMEAAMMRLQTELESFAKENKELRSMKEHEERSSQKHKSAADRHTKELVLSRRKIEELEEKMKLLEKQNKQLTRERDGAAASLAQVQSQALQRTSHLQETNALRTREIEELQKKLKASEERARQLEIDKENILAANAAEVSNLRAAHSKALETLLSYQNENDKLREKINSYGGPVEDDDSRYDMLIELDRENSADASPDDRRPRTEIQSRTQAHTYNAPHHTHTASVSIGGLGNRTVSRSSSATSLTQPVGESRDRMRKVEELVTAKRTISAPRGFKSSHNPGMPPAVAQIVNRQPGPALQRAPPQPPARTATPGRQQGGR